MLLQSWKLLAGQADFQKPFRCVRKNNCTAENSKLRRIQNWYNFIYWITTGWNQKVVSRHRLFSLGLNGYRFSRINNFFLTLIKWLYKKNYFDLACYWVTWGMGKNTQHFILTNGILHSQIVYIIEEIYVQQRTS